MNELSINEIQRQDFVDNRIYELIQDLNPTFKEVNWDIELIGDVRDIIANWFANRLKICSEKKFYSLGEE